MPDHQGAVVTDAGCNKKILCVHPHGIIGMGWGLLFNRPELTGVTFCFSTTLFKFGSISRLLTSLLGRPNSCDKNTVQALMRKERAIALIPGGFSEATLTNPGSSRVFLRTRSGFVYYALKYGH